MRKQAVETSATQSPSSNRRSLLKSITAASLGLMAGGAVLHAPNAAAGQTIYVAVQGAELFVHPTNLSAILYMDEGVAVDVLYGPHNGMYEVRYYGTDGWIWAEYLSLNGAGSAGVGSNAPVQYDAPVAASGGEHWIDVCRSSGRVRLMIGDETYSSFWGSLGWESSDHGFYATAIGTYYVYGFRYELHYTAYADNYITHWVAFDPERYNGFHSYTKDAYGNVVPNGSGRTAGCVALAAGDIDQLYDFAQMSMRVEIHW